MKQTPISSRWIQDPRAAAAVIDSVINYFENRRLSQRKKYRKSAFETLIFELHNRLAGNRPLLAWWTDHADIGAVLSCLDDYLVNLWQDHKSHSTKADKALFNALEPHVLTWRESINNAKFDKSSFSEL